MSEVSVIFRAADLPQPRAVAVPVREIPVSEEIWREEEFRDWPPLEWPEEPVRPAAPTRAVVWQIRVLAAVGVVGVVLLFRWLLTPEIRGEAWFFWPVFVCMAYRALWWIVEWLNYARPKFEQHVEPKRQWTV